MNRHILFRNVSKIINTCTQVRNVNALRTKCARIYFLFYFCKLTVHRDEIFGSEMITDFKILPLKNLMISLKRQVKRSTDPHLQFIMFVILPPPLPTL